MILNDLGECSLLLGRGQDGDNSDYLSWRNNTVESMKHVRMCLCSMSPKSAKQKGSVGS